MDVRVTVSAWCVIDHADMTLAFAYDNNIATCSATSLRREKVFQKQKKKISNIKFSILAKYSWNDRCDSEISSE
jgi:hypothetical protein